MKTMSKIFVLSILALLIGPACDSRSVSATHPDASADSGIPPDQAQPPDIFLYPDRDGWVVPPGDFPIKTWQDGKIPPEKLCGQVKKLQDWSLYYSENLNITGNPDDSSGTFLLTKYMYEQTPTGWQPENQVAVTTFNQKGLPYSPGYKLLNSAGGVRFLTTSPSQHVLVVWSGDWLATPFRLHRFTLTNFHLGESLLANSWSAINWDGLPRGAAYTPQGVLMAMSAKNVSDGKPYTIGYGIDASGTLTKKVDFVPAFNESCSYATAIGGNAKHVVIGTSGWGTTNPGNEQVAIHVSSAGKQEHLLLASYSGKTDPSCASHSAWVKKIWLLETGDEYAILWYGPAYQKYSRHWITYLKPDPSNPVGGGHKLGSWIEVPTTVTDVIPLVGNKFLAASLNQSTNDVELVWLQADDIGSSPMAQIKQKLKVGVCGASGLACKDTPKLAKAGGSIGVVWGANVPGQIQAQASFFQCVKSP